MKKPVNSNTMNFKNCYASQSAIEAAYNKVRWELQDMGLLDTGTRLDEVDCTYSWLAVGSQGLYFPDANSICISTFYPAGLLPEWYEKRILPDVFRHEFGHATAENYSKHFRGGIFRKAFDANYGEYEVFDGEDWSDDYVTEYASSMTQEDFAETFMLFMKHKGKLPARYRGKRAIERKWKAVAKIVKSIAADVTREQH